MCKGTWHVCHCKVELSNLKVTENVLFMSKIDGPNDFIYRCWSACFPAVWTMRTGQGWCVTTSTDTWRNWGAKWLLWKATLKGAPCCRYLCLCKGPDLRTLLLGQWGRIIYFPGFELNRWLCFCFYVLCLLSSLVPLVGHWTLAYYTLWKLL